MAAKFLINTYISCISEHLDEEDNFGRLSMWRAYSQGSTGIGLVLNNSAILDEAGSDVLKVYASPVAYLSDEGFENQLKDIVERIETEADLLVKQDRDTMKDYLFNMLMFAAICTKHTGFAAEMEWRIIYTPLLAESVHLVKEVEIVRGTPQPVYKLPLCDIPEEGLVGIEIPQLIDRIIIGPTPYPIAITEAFEWLLADAGVEDAGERIFVSDIPLRT